MSMILRNTLVQALFFAALLPVPAALAQTINPFPLDPAQAADAGEPALEEPALPEPLIHLDDETVEKQLPMAGPSDIAPPPEPLSARMSDPEFIQGVEEITVEDVVIQPEEIELEAPMPVQQVEEPEQEAPVKTPVKNKAQWTAMSGEDVRVVLGRWSEAANVAFVWDSQVQFEVLEPVNVVSYESAVRALLSQYKGGDVRPYGVLNVEPETGGRTLTVDSSEGG